METQKPVQGNEEDIHSAVRQHYGKAAARFTTEQTSPAQSSCCGPQPVSSCCGGQTQQTAEKMKSLYETPEAQTLPEEVSGLSMGCGDPISIAQLQPGETVLDLGSGGGIDCFLAAKKVGESGHVIGVDMTAEMIEKARANQKRMGYPNVEFRLGEIEHLPVADASVDVIISNCVINLSPDKPRVLGEAFRVLKPGGKFAVSDIVTDGPLPKAIKDSMAAWAGCIAGALDVNDFVGILEKVGFQDVKVQPSYFDEETIREEASKLCCGEDQKREDNLAASYAMDAKEAPVRDVDISLQDIAKAIYSARISAVKPA